MRNQWSFEPRLRSPCWTAFAGGVLTLFMASGFAGCSAENTLGRQAVKGSVTLDGQPLASGSIRFEPQNVSGIKVSAGAVIHNGQFVILEDQGLPKGSYKVSISSPEGGNQEPSMPAPNVPPPRERIPEKYNINTTLTVEIPTGAQKGLTFELKSQ
ncbi:MAG: hypothetical protein ACKV2Q_30515 [Planctomycetaceae bacterium]